MFESTKNKRGWDIRVLSTYSRNRNTGAQLPEPEVVFVYLSNNSLSEMPLSEFRKAYGQPEAFTRSGTLINGVCHFDYCDIWPRKRISDGLPQYQMNRDSEKDSENHYSNFL